MPQRGVSRVPGALAETFFRLVLALGLAILLGSAVVRAQVLEPLPPDDPAAATGGDPAAPPPWRLQIVKLPAAPTSLAMVGRRLDLRALRIDTADGASLKLRECGEGLCAEPIVGLPNDPYLPDGAVPGTRMAEGPGNILAAWLAEPTDRLERSVFGGSTNAGRLVVEDARRKRFTLELDLGSVFEDVVPRLADIDDDKDNEVVLVRSRVAGRSLVSVAKLRGDGLAIIAESAPEETAEGWPGPVGIADYDGDGRVEIATVGGSDGEGVLQLWRLEGDRLALVADPVGGVARHEEGSPVVGPSATADFDADGILDLALPSPGRTSLRLLTFKSGMPSDLARLPLPAEIVTDIVTIPATDARRAMLVMGLADNRMAIVH